MEIQEHRYHLYIDFSLSLATTFRQLKAQLQSPFHRSGKYECETCSSLFYSEINSVSSQMLLNSQRNPG